MRQDVSQERVRGDVERHAEKDVGTALIDLAGHAAIRDMQLDETMAGRERHLLELADVPGAQDDAPRIGVTAKLLDYARNLVDLPAVILGQRSLAALMISEDADFAAAAATRRLALHAASGELKGPRRLLGWL